MKVFQIDYENKKEKVINRYGDTLVIANTIQEAMRVYNSKHPESTITDVRHKYDNFIISDSVLKDLYEATQP